MSSESRLFKSTQARIVEALAGETPFLRAVLDSLEDAIAAFDPQGVFVLCNRKFETLFGLSAPELKGHDELWLRQCLRERLQAPEQFWRPSEAGAGAREDVVNLTSPGRARPYVLNWYWGPVLDETGRVAGHIAVQRDITRETEVDQMKTDFISIVSHELRTPMTSIRGYVDLILDGDTGEINDLQRQFLKTVQRNTMRLTAMVNDMLDISRIEDGGIELDVRDLWLENIVTQAAVEARPQIAAKGLTLNIVCADESGRPVDMPRVQGDHDRLIQVMTNLLSNAIKYTPPPPESPGQITIDIHVGEVQVQVALRDTGIGISADDISMLFQKFFRADNPQTRDVDGTGLGLSITRALIEKMGGELQVKSQVGDGSEFSFTLPLARTKVARPKPMAHSTQSSLLIVTANADSAAAEKKKWASRSDDIAISSAYSCGEAIRHLEAMVTEAVLVDIGMPYGDAFRILRFLGTQQPGMVVGPLQGHHAEKPASNKVASQESPVQPMFATLPVHDPRALKIDLRALLGRSATALVVRSQNDAVRTPAKVSLGKALDSLRIPIARLGTVAEALATVHQNERRSSALLMDLSAESNEADEQAVQLIETLGLEAGANRKSVPLVLFICQGYVLACFWPQDDSFQRQHFEELIDRDRQQVSAALQMAT